MRLQGSSAAAALGDYQYFRGHSRPIIAKRASIMSRGRARSGSVSAISTVSSSSQPICDHRAIAYLRANSGCFSSHWNTVLRPGIVLSEQISLSVSPSIMRSQITSAISTLQVDGRPRFLVVFFVTGSSADDVSLIGIVALWCVNSSAPCCPRTFRTSCTFCTDKEQRVHLPTNAVTASCCGGDLAQPSRRYQAIEQGLRLLGVKALA